MSFSSVGFFVVCVVVEDVEEEEAELYPRTGDILLPSPPRVDKRKRIFVKEKRSSRRMEANDFMVSTRGYVA